MPAFLDSFFDQLPNILLLVLGFGFVIFWHELGHFLAAKWADVKVEQFAVGFGQALLSWRKGLGLRVGSSRAEYESLAREYLEKNSDAEQSAGHRPVEMASEEQRLSTAADALGLGETEYRLNWIPLGGYVKMLGQDDLQANAEQNDPRAYNMKPIGKRMVIVSAGVIMNVILAIIGFAVLFRIGFDAPPPVVGAVLPGSPAQKAGIEVGDRILTIDGKVQHDFTKIQMNVLLLHENTAVPVVVRRHDGSEARLMVTPVRSEPGPAGLLQLGVLPSSELRGADRTAKQQKEIDSLKGLVPAEAYALNPGDRIVAINGDPVPPTKKAADGTTLGNYWFFDQKLQESNGKPVELTVESSSGARRTVTIHPQFADPFPPGQAQLNFAGLVPRASVDGVTPDSSGKGKLEPGDAVVSVTVNPGTDTVYNPSPELFRDRLRKAAEQDQANIDMVVERDGKEVTVKGLTPTVKLPQGGYGLGVQPGYDTGAAVVGNVLDKSPAAEAGLSADSSHPGATVITQINGQPVKNWFDVQRILSGLPGPGEVSIAYSVGGGPEKTATLKLGESDLAAVKGNRYVALLSLADRIEPRQTKNPLVAVQWGAEETWDLIVQFYQTLQRMIFARTVSYKNMMGPVGIFTAGTKFAERGTDWLIWFLSMISANLAVVNFLPIPIVDGGLFTFLIIEKIQGRPISPRVQSIAQVVGLALILSVFILVTIQDITRH